MRRLHLRTKGSSDAKGFFTEEAFCTKGETSSSSQERSPDAFNSMLKESDVSLSRGSDHITSSICTCFFSFLYPNSNKSQSKETDARNTDAEVRGQSLELIGTTVGEIEFDDATAELKAAFKFSPQPVCKLKVRHTPCVDVSICKALHWCATISS